MIKKLLKQNTSHYAAFVLQRKGERKMKDKTTALILSILLGTLGVDRFYLGYTGMGVLKLLTGGCFGVMWIIDIVNIATGKLLPADGSGYSDDSNASAKPSGTDSLESLKKISELHNQGVLNDAEYEKMKKEILEKV